MYDASNDALFRMKSALVFNQSLSSVSLLFRHAFSRRIIFHQNIDDCAGRGELIERVSIEIEARLSNDVFSPFLLLIDAAVEHEIDKPYSSRSTC